MPKSRVGGSDRDSDSDVILPQDTLVEWGAAPRFTVLWGMNSNWAYIVGVGRCDAPLYTAADFLSEARRGGRCVVIVARWNVSRGLLNHRVGRRDAG